MKRIFLVVLMTLCAAAAQAHVLLTTAYSVAGPIGIVACSAPHITMTSATPSYTTLGTLNTVTVTYSMGTATYSGGIDSAFTVATCAPTYSLSLSLVSGQWTLNLNGCCQVAAGTLGGSALTQAVTNYQGSA